MSSSSSSSSGTLSTSTIIAILSTSALIYTQWSNLPEWLRKAPMTTTSSSEGTRSSSDDIDKDANDELANPAAVLAKLTEMNDLLDKVMDETHAATSTRTDTTTGTRDIEQKADKCMGQMDLLAAFYSLIHLYREIFAKDPDYRDKQYHSSNNCQKEGGDDHVPLQDLHELAEYLEYAHWAYQKSDDILSKNCRQAGLDLIAHDTATEPGRVGHFIALNHASKLAIVGLKGTSTISDVLTDLIAIPKEHVGCHFDDADFAAANNSKSDIDGATDSMRVHEGIFTAALWMADKLQPMIENLLLPLKYKVVLCGHSLGTFEYEKSRMLILFCLLCSEMLLMLTFFCCSQIPTGAGTACLLGLELRSRIQAFRQNYTDLRVLAYATPPVVSYKASRACAPFVTSMVNNADIVTRSSVGNLIILNKLLIKINEKLKAKGLTIDSWASLKKYYEEHSTIDDELLLVEDELDAFFEETHADPETETEALFVPGKVVVIWDKGESNNHEIGGVVTGCGMKMLRQIELDLSMVKDHFLKGYRNNLKKLIEQLENTI